MRAAAKHVLVAACNSGPLAAQCVVDHLHACILLLHPLVLLQVVMIVLLLLALLLQWLLPCLKAR
jgi:hypothetical protein